MDQINIMTFINAMVNAADLLERRVEVRREFIDLGLLDCIQTNRDWVDEHRASGNHVANMSQVTGLLVFVLLRCV